MKKFVDIIKAEPLVFLLGACVLVLAVMGTSVRHVSSTMSAIVFLLSFLVIKDWAKLYLSLPKLEKIFLFSLLFYTVSAAFSYYNAGDADRYFKLFDHYLRFTLIIPVYLLIIKNNISILNYLLTGAVVSGPFLFFIALSSYLSNPDVPAQGYYHHIIFGQLAMLNVGIMLCMLLTKNFDRYMQVLIMFSMLLGLVAAVMSQARGVWLVFPVYMMVAIYYTVKDKYLSINHVVIFLVVAVLLSVVSPIGDLIKQRSEMAVTEVTRFYTEDHYVSSVGTRLAMWDIAVDVWKKNPVLGTGPGDFDDEVMALQKQGEYVGMDVHNSVHNIFFQALVDSGIVGLMALLFAVIIMPLKVFLGNPDKEGRLVGIITVVSFAVFGMSESWTLRSSSISMFLVYIVVITSHMHVVQSKK